MDTFDLWDPISTISGSVLVVFACGFIGFGVLYVM